MSVRTAAAGALLVVCGLSGCGGNSGLPQTPANRAVCKTLAAYLAGKTSVQELAASVVETNAPISHQLRQDVAQFAVTMASAGASAAQQYESQARQDCQSVTG
jgi:hypothetical protein